MRSKAIFIASGLGFLLALMSAFLFSRQPAAQPPLFNPAANPYGKGIYSNGVIESDQPDGANINIYPEVAGPIVRVLVSEGQAVHKNDPLIMIDDAVQRAAAEQQQAQAEGASAALRELKAQPRPETLHVAAAQLENAKATLNNARDQLAKQQRAYEMDPKSISRDAYDNARNAEAIASTNFDVVLRQYELVKAGAWTYDIENAEKSYTASSKAYQSAAALLGKYTIRAPMDGVILALQAGTGSYVSTQGAYDTYTQSFGPLVVMGPPQDHMQVRAYIDEILVHELPEPGRIAGDMVIRGTERHVPLTFVRVQPFISPKIELSNERQERVDLRVLPVIFRFSRPQDMTLYPGQLVDVYVGSK
jgi:HlyD family secretion protein